MSDAPSRRARPPFRADHVGSLLRPAELKDARARHQRGELDADGLREAEDRAVRAGVAMQEEVGLRAATDGEARRGTWHMDFIHQIGGLGTADGHHAVRFQNAGGAVEWTPSALTTTDRLHLPRTIFGEHFSFLADTVTTAMPKQTIPSPSMSWYREGPAMIDPTVYPEPDEFWADLADVYQQEIAALHDLGCRYLQLDDTSLAYLNDPAQRANVSALGMDGEHAHEHAVEQMNAALRGRPDDMVVTTHLCRGNFRSSWAASGGYDHVAEALFGGLDVDAFFLEFDDERSGGFEPLRFLAPDKLVVLGLVTSKRPELESPDDLARRIDEAAKVVDLDRLCLSPQCGFSSTEEGNDLTADDQRAKLDLVVRTAEKVWGSV